MTDWKLGVVLMVAGAALFLLSDNLFGDSDLAYNAGFLGLILLPVGVVLTLVGVIHLAIARIRERARRG
jgi:hypothetical protein